MAMQWNWNSKELQNEYAEIIVIFFLLRCVCVSNAEKPFDTQSNMQSTQRMWYWSDNKSKSQIGKDVMKKMKKRKGKNMEKKKKKKKKKIEEKQQK